MKAIKALLSMILIVFIIAYISDVSQAVSQAILRCLNIIIPSLFIMMIASRYIITKDILSPIEKLFRPICFITGMNERMVSVFLMSNIGGYPIGASMLAQMCQNGQITKKDAEIAASYCFGSGPAFVIGAVGLCVYNSRNIGILMFISCITANLIACILYNRSFRTSFRKKYTSNEITTSYSLTDAITESGSSLLKMCAVIIAFSVIKVVLDKMSNFLSADFTYISPIFEITNATSSEFSKIQLAYLTSAFTAFGGLCVWMQNAALIDKSFSILKALILRIPVSALSAAIFKVLYSNFSASYLSANAEFNGFVVNIDNFLPSICLIIMIFLLFNKKRLAFL